MLRAIIRIKRTFVPTHVISLKGGESIPVMVDYQGCDCLYGPAYTEGEFNVPWGIAKFDFFQDIWTLDGKPFEGTVELIKDQAIKDLQRQLWACVLQLSSLECSFAPGTYGRSETNVCIRDTKTVMMRTGWEGKD
jgi:hypothetical protein